MSSSIVVKMIAKQQQQQQQQHHLQAGNLQKRVARMSTRRIFTPVFKLKVLHSYRNDIDCRGNQRATARKYKIHRRQIQKWLQVEENLRNSCKNSTGSVSESSSLVSTPAASPQKELAASAGSGAVATSASPALNLSPARLHGDELAVQQPPPPRPPPSAAAAAAAQALAAAAAQQRQSANYRFHHQLGAPAVVVPTSNHTGRGYPTAVVQPQYQYPEYSLLYPQPLASAYHRHQAQTQFDHLHHHRGSAFQPTAFSVAERKMIESAALSPASTVSSLMSPRSIHPEDHPEHLQLHSQPQHHHQQQQQQHFATATEIKTERTSTPDPAAAMTSPGLYYYHRAPTTTVFKREKLEDDYQHSTAASDYRRASLSSSGVSELSCSPAPSHLSGGCPSPLPSSGGSDSEMDLSPAGNGQLGRIRRSYSLRFKLDVLDAFHRDSVLAGNQRATARNFGINRRQVQKWLKQESDLRGVIELCASSDSRQRLGPVQDSAETAVDLRTTPPYETSLTPPYSTPGCTFSCCPDGSPSNSYYCYSPMDVDSVGDNSPKQTACSQTCCNPASAKKDPIQQRAVVEDKQQQQEQETPLCLVKPKEDATPQAASMSGGQVEEPVSSSVPSPPAAAPSSAQGAILFKPYLDNVIAKPSKTAATTNNNNNNQDARDLNENQVSPTAWIGQKQQQQPAGLYLDQYSQVKSAFVRYPSTGHYA